MVYQFLLPVAIGRYVMARDLFTFLPYIATRPSSPVQKKLGCGTDNNTVPEDAAAENITASTCNVLPVSKASVLHALNSTMSITEPSNKERYEKLFVHKKILQDILEIYFGKDRVSLRRVEQWVGCDGSLGKTVRQVNEGQKVRGRWLWVLRKEYRAVMNVHELYIRHIQTADIVTIGYARKSLTNESQVARVRLLQAMVDKLRSRCLVRKVFVSPRSNASTEFEKRDVSDSNISIIKDLMHCAGTTQDLIHRFKTNFKPVRLVVIDYAGLSTNFGDIQNLFEKYSQLVEVIVDLDYAFDTISRQSILDDNGVSSKFNCRVGSKKRSLEL